MYAIQTARVVALLCALAAIPHIAYAAEPALPSAIILPTPHTDGKVSVEGALKERRSVRNPAPTPLTLEEVGQLCWAAQGTTDAHGHRTAPSAQAKYPLELYVLAGAVTGLAPGLYHYRPSGHALRPVSSGDLRGDFVTQGVGQGWVAKAPAIFVVTGVAEKMASMGERGRPFMWIEVGLAAQGFFLQATGLGLGSTFVGGFRPPQAATVLGLPAAEEVLAVLPVGRKP
jgi:SagB-type dehydrogenase family enzyme